jgi:hypothetical protein
MRHIKAAVFGVGGIPSGPWINDPPLRAMLLETANRGDPTLRGFHRQTHLVIVNRALTRPGVTDPSTRSFRATGSDDGSPTSGPVIANACLVILRLNDREGSVDPSHDPTN